MDLDYQEILIAVLVVLLFVLALWVSLEYQHQIASVVANSAGWGMVVYLMVNFFSVVLAPAISLPFMPIAVAAWGPLVTAILATFGWVLGAIVSFCLAQRFGRPVVDKMIRLDQAQHWLEKIPQRYNFSTVFVAHLLLPTAVVSYAVGFLLSVRLGVFSLASVLAITLSTFLLTYGVSLPFLFL